MISSTQVKENKIRSKAPVCQGLNLDRVKKIVANKTKAPWKKLFKTSASKLLTISAFTTSRKEKVKYKAINKNIARKRPPVNDLELANAK